MYRRNLIECNGHIASIWKSTCKRSHHVGIVVYVTSTLINNSPSAMEINVKQQFYGHGKYRYVYNVKDRTMAVGIYEYA